MSEKLYKIIAKILDVPVSDINDESSPETLENWDSFNSLVIADELESEFNISFALEEIIDSANVSAIKKHLKNHLILVPIFYPKEMNDSLPVYFFDHHNPFHHTFEYHNHYM